MACMICPVELSASNQILGSRCVQLKFNLNMLLFVWGAIFKVQMLLIVF